ncbi:Vacuolar inheritance and morphology protein [Coemansia thaxteri]|uniref:Vacuolar inheritance and morphology protein n=1 Tax=Coemansia thaxteri TaxID=2663907 RepID=A0A9W8BGV6_9FUNG|nr:Vacuolar inheritance and morphology protein [Coemansia thaxteri]KAJ2008348.1 Vacuolar inheritance and morphology protein [Coemansia thaxteri]KAJ2473180.1 Vacuolar inheritance and morphology protein [Coemansia sp. RSA 2322]KAJ2485942.1 Vacuolar inheritance and morphology protein [Coemansia sp. RSA 2320]
MEDEDEQQHKTMIKQLTDLDDHALDEQAGLFMHPRRKSMRSETTPRPVSQPFFQPLQVFPDVLNVSAMVERQEQKEQKEQIIKDAAAPRDSSGDQPATAAFESAFKPAAMVPPGNNAFLKHDAPMNGLAASSSQQTPPPLTALQLSRSPSGVATMAGPAIAVAADRANTAMSVAAPKQPRAGVRSVSLTRTANEIVDSSASKPGSGNVSSSGRDNRGDSKGLANPAALVLETPMHPVTQTLRSATPFDTSAEEGVRQLGFETSKGNKGGKRAGKRATGANPNTSGSGGGVPKGAGRRLIARTGKHNASSRGSEEENYTDNDDDEQFIYRNSRTSLHVSSSIPEESYEEHGDSTTAVVAGKQRRSNRHRLSAYMGSVPGNERRNSSGVGRAGSTGDGAMLSSSYNQTYSSSTTANAATGGTSTNNIVSSHVDASGNRLGKRAGRAARSSGFNSSSANANNGGTGHRFSILTQSNNDYGMTSEESDMDGEPAALRSTYNNQYSRRNSRRVQSNVYYGSSEEMPETTPLFRRHQGHQRRRGNTAAQILRAILYSVMLLVGLFVVVTLFNFTSAPLDNVEAIKVSNILATEKELLFILHVQSTNPNIREVLIERAEIGVFAAAAVPSNTTAFISALRANETEPAILLGNVYELSDPMRFAPGSLTKPATDLKTTQISIHHPGASLGGGGGSDDENSDAAKWRRLIKGPYDLTVRGTLQYTLWQRNYAARICISKLANLPTDNTTSFSFSIAAGLGCDENDDDTITLPHPPALPFFRMVHRLFGRP